MVNVVNRCLRISIGTGILSIASLGLGASLPAQAATFTLNAVWSGAEFGNNVSAKASIVMDGDPINGIDRTSPIYYNDAIGAGTPVLSVDMTVSKLLSDGTTLTQKFTSSDFAFFTFDTTYNTKLDFTKNLVGQALAPYQTIDPTGKLVTISGKTWNTTSGVYTYGSDPTTLCSGANPDPFYCVKQTNGTWVPYSGGYNLAPKSATASYAGDFNFFKVDPPSSCGNDYPTGYRPFAMATCFNGTPEYIRLTSVTVQPVPVPGVMFGAIAAGVYFSAQALRKKKASSLAKSNA